MYDIAATSRLDGLSLAEYVSVLPTDRVRLRVLARYAVDVPVDILAAAFDDDRARLVAMQRSLRSRGRSHPSEVPAALREFATDSSRIAAMGYAGCIELVRVLPQLMAAFDADPFKLRCLLAFAPALRHTGISSAAADLVEAAFSVPAYRGLAAEFMITYLRE